MVIKRQDRSELAWIEQRLQQFGQFGQFGQWEQWEQWEQAIALCQELLQQEPCLIAAHELLGQARHQQGCFLEAIAHYQKAFELLEQPETVLMAANQAFSVRPEALWYHLGMALQALREPDEAWCAYLQALMLQPDYGEALNALGTLLEQQRSIEEAIAHYQQACQLLPTAVSPWLNLGHLQLQQQQWQAAEATFRRVLQLDPTHLKGLDGLLEVLLQTCQWSERQALAQRLWELGQDKASADVTIWNTLLLPFSAAQRQVFAKNKAAAIAQTVCRLPQPFNYTLRQCQSAIEADASAVSPNSVSSQKRIRLGYVSSHFGGSSHLGDSSHWGDRPIAPCILRLLELHDRQQFEVFAYALSPDNASPDSANDYRQKFQRDSDCFRQVGDLLPGAIAQQIYEDGVDILIDLEGPTALALEVYALRPAPVIVSYLGHPGTSGADFIDYLVTDSMITPPDQTQWITEKCLYLPTPYWLTNDRQPIATAVPARADYGLPEDGFVFCGFNPVSALEPTLFAIWMQILKQVPNSVLWLRQSNPAAEQNLIMAAAAFGVAADRLIFAPAATKPAYLAQHRYADLYLDTQPNLEAAIDALWAGLPVLTLAGADFATRITASSLMAIDLPELIVSTLAEYERLAVELATHPHRLGALRQRLHQGRAQSNLFNPRRTMCHLETAYRLIWENAMTGQPPQEIDVPAIEPEPIPKINQSLANQPSLPPPLSLFIYDVLTPEEIDQIVAKLAIAEFVDGRMTAGTQVQEVKYNTQLDHDGAIAAEVMAIVVNALGRNRCFQSAVLPNRFRPPLFNRYEAGMTYGNHVDSPIMGTPPMRSDVSLTLFLSDPSTYTGGELVIEESQRSYPVKLAAGAMVVYPSSTLHRVEPVTQGVRLAAVAWVQSLVRDPGDRQLLFDLHTVQQSLFEQSGKTKEFDLVAKSHANLLRKWADV